MAARRGRLIEDDDEILEVARRAKRVAVLGIKPESRSSEPAFYVPEYLARQGVEVVPVPTYYPEVQQILGRPVVRRLPEVGPVDLVDVFRRPDDLMAHVPDLVTLAPPCVWLQLGIHSRTFADAMIAAGIDVVEDRCLLVERRRATSLRPT